jgi:trans-aconitate 3-methyltransferase
LNPNPDKVEEIVTHFRDVVLGPYITAQNRLAQSGYAGLEMPWDWEETAGLYDKDAFLRRQWISTDEVVDGQDFFEADSRKAWPMPAVEAMLGTTSPVTRWREAHPDLVGTEKDCLKVHIKELCEAMGVPKGQENSATLRGAVGLSLICVKRA